MDTPGVFIMSSLTGDKIARALQRLLAQNGLDGVQIGRADNGPGGGGHADTPRRMALRHDFGIRIILAADLARGGALSTRDGVIFDLGVMSGALGVGRGVVLVVGMDDVEPDLGGGFAGVVVDRVSLNSTDDPQVQLGAYARLLAGRILELETNAGFVMRPSTGLAIGYFKNFLTPVLEALRSRRAGLTTGQGASKGQGVVAVSVRLVICLPDNAERVISGAWTLLARRLGLEQAELGPIGEGGARRNFEVWADGRKTIYDAPDTLATAADIVRRLVADENDRPLAQTRALHNFGRTLRLMLREPEHAWMKNRVEIVYWSELERRAGNA